MIHSLQVYMLCKLILAARTHSAKGVPTWAEPVIRLFDLTISPWGQDFNILYAPVSTSPDYAQSHHWVRLGDYWYSVIFIWNTRLRKKLTRRQSRFDKSITPNASQRRYHIIREWAHFGWITQAIGLDTTFCRPFDFSPKRLIQVLRWYQYGCVSVCGSS